MSSMYSETTFVHPDALFIKETLVYKHASIFDTCNAAFVRLGLDVEHDANLDQTFIMPERSRPGM